MPKLLWSDINPGDRVELNGREWTVTKAKPKGKRIKVTVTSGTNTATSEVRARDSVVKVKAPLRTRVGNGNAQARWATDEERRKVLGPGDASVTKRPAKPSGDPWELPRDRVERKLDEILGAKLIAEGDETVGYYVPPVDVTTIAAHLALMHSGIYKSTDDEATMMRLHSESHTLALDGVGELPANHWHTKTRPENPA